MNHLGELLAADDLQLDVDVSTKEQVLRKTIAQFPDFAPARMNLGVCLSRQGRKAESDLRREFMPLWADRPIAEISALDVRTIVKAAKDRGAGAGVYAMRFISEAGKKDGLYWPAATGEEESPLGELFAAATRQGYHAGEGRSPFHGYYYKILTRQGPAAAGGAVDYVVRGKMIGGFALVAYPAEYRNSGVMTFLVNHDGTVFQKDLGPKTAQIAEAMTSFNPDPTWRKVEVTEPRK